jgi:hypothetical protein
MVMDADFGAAQAGKILLSLVGAGAVKRVGFLVIDSFYLNDRSLGNAGADEGGGLALRAKHGWHRIAAAFAHDDDHLPFAVLVAGISAVTAIFFLVCWFYITSKIATIYFGRLALATDDAATHFLRHCFAQLVQKDESALVAQAQVAAESQSALALHFVAEHGNGRQIAFEGQLVAGEQCPASDAEILFAALAAEAERAIRAARFVSIKRAAEWANRSAIGIGPTKVLEGRLGFPVSHAEDLS